MTQPAPLGTAVIAYIEPHAGFEAEFNRWYELDHYYAAAMAAPGACAGGRWVATRACKAVRPASTLLGDSARGSYLAAYWILDGVQPEWDAWVAGQMGKLVAEQRMFSGRDHVHTAVYRFLGEAQANDGPPVIAALDRCFPGVVAVASTATASRVESWVGELVGAEVPVAAILGRERMILAEEDPGDHVLALLFCAGDVLETWHEHVAPALADLDGVGFASPFLRTIPGTDTYTDEL